MNVHHCPACELRFRNKTELQYHWTEEHAPPPGEEEEIVDPERDTGHRRTGADGRGA